MDLAAPHLGEAMVRCGLAIALVGLALFLSLLLHRIVSDAFLLLFLAAVVASGWFGRTGPGLFAVLLSSLAIDYYFLPPYRGLRMNVEAIPYFLTFLFTSVAASWLSSTRKQEHERQRAYLDELFDQTPEAIMVLDLKGRVLRINREFSRMFGFAQDEIVGTLGMAAVVPSDLHAQVSGSQTRFDREEGVAIETVRERKDRSRVRVSELVVPIVVDRLRLAEYFIYRDITKIKEAEEALQAAKAELAHLSRVTTMGELVASIAHEVNQPITGIISTGRAGVHWLNMVPADLDEARGAFTRIIRDADRASAVIARVRSLLNKNVPHHMESVDVNELINTVLMLINSELEKGAIRLRTELAAAMSVIGDRVQLQQVILNLAMNSIDAMSSVNNRPRELHLRTSDDGNRVTVQVQDSGVGLDQERLESVFLPFFTTKPQGIGMGLSISRSIVEMHGGTLEAAPLSEGAIFRFSLPREE